MARKLFVIGQPDLQCFENSNLLRFICCSLTFKWLLSGWYLLACGKPTGHREVSPREFDVHSRWKLEREAEAEKKQKKQKKKKKKKKKGRRRQSRKTEAACVASACCNTPLTVYQITDPRKVATGTVYELPI